jgi:IS605 OrfB family transposase
MEMENLSNKVRGPMAKATKTIQQPLGYKPEHTAWFVATKVLFNQVAAYYFEAIQAHPGILDLDTKAAILALESLTHATKAHPHPVMPLSTIAENIPTVFRRAALSAALGSARSFSSNLTKWRKQKEKALAKGKKFTIHPPIPPRCWNKPVTCYAGQWRERTSSSIVLKLWTGTSWAWVKCRLLGRDIPDGWEPRSTQLVLHGSQWWLHTPLERAFKSPGKVETQLTTNPDVHICSVDLNIDKHLAVCTIQTVEGTVLATQFIDGGKALHGFRKKLLGRIARKRGKTRIIAEGEQDNAALWAKVRNVDKQAAHRVSCRIVDFAKKHRATILVFEHLGHFRPQKGKYSKRGNEKRTYWLRGKIFKYSKYKAWNEGIVTSRVSPWNTSRECARCGAPVARYNAGQPAEGYTPGAPLVYCSACQMRGHSDRNACIVIGQRLLTRYQKTPSQKKPSTPLSRIERSLRKEGDARSQVAKRRGRPSINPAWHGESAELGTAQDTGSRMGETVSGIPRQLRLFNE